MLRRTVCIPLFLVLASVAGAQPTPLPFPTPKGLLPAKLAVKAGKPLILDASAAKGKIKWRLDFDQAFAVIDGKKLAFASPYNGTYKVLLISFDDALDSECEITVTGGGPMPPPDDPPPMPDDPAMGMAKLTKAVGDLAKMVAASSAGTDAKLAQMEKRIAALETPRPPDPKPVDPPLPPAPFPATGLSVLIVYDTNTPLPSAQQMIITGKVFRDYLNAKCAIELDGKTRSFMIWDKGVDTANANANWRAAFALSRPSIPYIHISNGKTGYSGPLPPSVPDAIALLQKYEVK